MDVEIEYTITGKLVVSADVYQELLDAEGSEKEMKDMSEDELSKFISEVEEENCNEPVLEDAANNGKFSLKAKLV